MTQVDRAIAALLEGWLSPKQLTEKSGRANPEGIRRDAKREATRRGLVWHEEQVEPERGRSYKVVCVTKPGEKLKPLPERTEGGTGGGAEPTRSIQGNGSTVSAKAQHRGPTVPSSSNWRKEVGVGANAQRVSGAARATGGEQGELWREPVNG